MPYHTMLKKLRKTLLHPSHYPDPKTNRVYSGPRPIRRPSFVENVQVVFVQSCRQTSRQSNGRGSKHNPVGGGKNQCSLPLWPYVVVRSVRGQVLMGYVCVYDFYKHISAYECRICRQRNMILASEAWWSQSVMAQVLLTNHTSRLRLIAGEQSVRREKIGRTLRPKCNHGTEQLSCDGNLTRY